MKLLINYDLINAVKNVNEPLTLFKIVRNEKNKYYKDVLPSFLMLDTLICMKNIERIPIILLAQYATSSAIIYSAAKAQDDQYKHNSRNSLIKLTNKLKDLNIDTEYNLLSKSTLDGKVINLSLNEKKLPVLTEKKYILVPAYQYDGRVKEVSVEQEHVIGSNEYVLSLGSKQRKLKPVYSSI